MACLRSLATRLSACTRGAAIVEFALVAPLFLMMLFAVFDTGMKVYASSVLQGAMQRVGRDFSMEDAYSRRTELENLIRGQVGSVVPGAQFTFNRRSYFDFGDIGQAEKFDDINADGQCNANEPFEDANGNGAWDSDRGRSGNGGARDAVVFTATVSYRRLLPLGALVGWPSTEELRATTVLRNQPYDEQNRTIPLGNCA
ncbi:TadE/TadG family type IV pilus assembly protein [Alteraurantiacibacter buctensis]|uniref:Pilus assembly protein n=1 Tax=Alteraurantiacibacter buctensis TaxID=1503981 RepID=A0A844Z423_9SPHN|nr:TadE/TadG family type IV pilus assembly protein [Alteraurantiacibacter buctensis]MXO73347.1 pilus assembly protein [Alteraurantiacibacter buctensis]